MGDALYHKIMIILGIVALVMLIMVVIQEQKEGFSVEKQIESNQKLTKELQTKFSNLSANVQKLKEK